MIGSSRQLGGSLTGHERPRGKGRCLQKVAALCKGIGAGKFADMQEVGKQIAAPLPVM